MGWKFSIEICFKQGQGTERRAERKEIAFPGRD